MNNQQVWRTRAVSFAVGCTLATALAAAIHLGGAAAQPGPKSEKAALSDEEKTKAEFDVIEKQGLVRYAAALNTQAERLEARISAAEEKLQQLEVSISKTRTRADKAHERIGMLKLGIAGTSTSPEYVCGKQHTEAVDNLRFMYGLRDGTGCNVTNINYYKELKLVIPPE